MKLKKIIYAAIMISIVGCSSSKKTTTETSSSDKNQKKALPKTPDDYRATATKMHDLVHTNLDVSFDWNNKQLRGSATLTIKPHFYPTQDLFLNARGMQINEVKIIHGESYNELAYIYRNDSICVTLDKVYTARDTFQIFIDYVSKPEDLVTGGSAAISSDKGLYFINADGSDPSKPQQVWTQGECQANSVWFPTIDYTNQKSTEEIYITVDTAFVTLSNGTLISSIVNGSNGTRTDYWRQTLPHAPYLFMMAVGKYAVVKDTWRGKEVSYYVEPEYEKYARNIFGHTPEMMEFFSNKLGVDYQWDKYASVVVRDYVSGAMENTSATVFGEFMQKDSRGLLDGSNEDYLSHELFHQWFGDLVTCESWSNLPLNESFATYGEYMWNEYKYGMDEADYNLHNDLGNYLREARNKQVDLVRFKYEKPDDMFDNHSYAKGGRVLHMLRKYTGDSAFYASLNLYLKRNMFKSVEIHDLRLAFEEITGEDLNWFFNEWFLDKGHPSLKIEYNYDAAAGKQIVTVQQMQSAETTPIYRIPVDIDIYESGSVSRHRVVLNHQSDVFEFNVKSKPELVNFDAQKMILCTKTDNHTTGEWVTMYKTGPLYLDRYEALSKAMKSYSAGTPEAEIVKLALNDKHWNLRLMAVRNSKTLIDSDKESMKQKLISMASGDPKSDVRDEAIVMLSEVFPKDADVNKMMHTAIHDSSYRVMESALLHIIETNATEGLTLVKELEKDENENVRDIVSDLYKIYGGDEQFDYMTSVLQSSGGYATYTAVQNYGKFLLRCSPANASKGLDYVEPIGRSHPQWFVRLSGVQTISELAKSYGKTSLKSGDPNVQTPGENVLNQRTEMENDKVRKKAETLLNDIKAKETDPNLTKIYHRDQ